MAAPGGSCIDQKMSHRVSDIDQHVENLMKKISSGSLTTKKGVSFLELKFHLLLSYVIDLTYYLLTKTDGKPWQEDPAAERLVEVRTVLEKLRPIDQKMKYQIDKMIKTATTGMTSGAEIDPLRFKPNPENMVSKVGCLLVYFEITDYEYGDAPQEIRDETLSRWRKQKEKEEEEERTRYEEENLLRLPAKKKKRISERAQSGMDELTSFADLSVLNAGEDDRNGEYSTKSSSSSKKSKSKWKKKFGSAKKKKGK
ncbi:neuroguidin-A-like [Orbicella faveolata]|uniref:neuroguidin-A-like n=1 Tax=Orbicella faveolata TaxID=48498 RepID=UPI0009E5677B|nr:neuroguidin-A-like [Orbicella faveolata]